MSIENTQCESRLDEPQDVPGDGSYTRHEKIKKKNQNVINVHPRKHFPTLFISSFHRQQQSAPKDHRKVFFAVFI